MNQEIAPRAGPGGQIRCALFDLEGTLVDFQWNLEEAEARLREAAAAVLGCAPEAFEGLNYAGILREGRLRAPDADARGRLVRALAPIYDHYDLDAASRWSLRPGAERVLSALSRGGIPRALVTNVGRLAVARVLARLGIGERLPVVVTRNDVADLKPSPEGLLRALAALGCAPDASLMVGDSLSDVGAARAAGLRVAIVLGGESAEADVRRAGPDHVVSRLEEILPLFGLS